MEAPTPLVLVDVDGVLNPSLSRTEGYRRHWVFPGGIAHRLLLNPGHGPMLLELAEASRAELVWATYWRARANTWIAPRIGLPHLRFVPVPPRWRSRTRSAPGIWKARHVAAWAGRTPFVWLEDDPTVAGYLAEKPDLGQYLVIKIDPAIGLTRHDLDTANIWLHDLDQ